MQEHPKHEKHGRISFHTCPWENASAWLDRALHPVWGRHSRLLQNSNMQQREEQRQRENPTIANTNTYTTYIFFIVWHFAMTIIQEQSVRNSPHWGARLGPHVAQLFQTCPTALAAAVLAVSPVARGFPPMASVKLKSLNGPQPKEKDRKKKLRRWKTPWRLLRKGGYSDYFAENGEHPHQNSVSGSSSAQVKAKDT